MKFNLSKQILIVVAVFAGIVSAACQNSVANDATVLDAAPQPEPEEEYAVYAALFEGEKRLKGPGLVSIYKETTYGRVLPVSTLEHVVELLRGRLTPKKTAVGVKIKESRILTDEMVEEYRSKNRTPRILGEPLMISVPYQFVDKTNRVPGPLLRLSRVAFNFEKNRAVLYMDFWVGPKNAEGGFRTFEKRDGIWKMVETYDIWAS